MYSFSLADQTISVLIYSGTNKTYLKCLKAGK